MPILLAEPEVFPENLFGEHGSPEHEGRAWWVMHTRPRQEKSLARQLHALATPYFLPQVPNRVSVRGRVLTSYLPLFPGYVFLLARAHERLGALSTRRVAQCLAVVDQGRLWEDLRQINRLLGAGATVRPEERLAPGAVVVIRSGPLAGLRGRVVRTASQHRFVVEVDFIQRGASIVLDDSMLSSVVP